ncbi:glycosyltransferase family 4 protein [Massilia sp. BJB1822]|uniref:glycosyltransferase family 4 protein n=1 Tax=Massilia sp. BJB1822 TaxID=2744470 RepID=UPI0015934D1A|nr:glycosyltransferase family 4 protein [Massilia sp. BJB1822]NVD99997.1 glycosyltransferase family 4 protein [Massilia sp. BJB1822]
MKCASAAPPRRQLLMMGTSPATRGGVAAVVQVYRAAGLFERYAVRYIATHCDGGAGAKLRLMALAYLRLLAALLRGQVGLLHVHTASRASFWRKYGLLALADCCGVPAILHLHGGEFAVFYERECGPLRRWLIRRRFDRAARVVVLSEQWQGWVRGISGNRHVEVIPNPVLAGAAAPWARHEPGTVLCLGRLNRGKGSYDLLAAAALLRAQGVTLRLLLAGDGEIEAVRAAARALGLEQQVELLGWVDAEHKQRLLARATVLALPSYHEGLPMCVLEAMAAGRPVVSTAVGGIPAAVADGCEGYLVAPGDVAALADRLGRLLGADALAQSLGAAARRKVDSTFASAAVLPRLERLYGELGMQPLASEKRGPAGPEYG